MTIPLVFGITATTPHPIGLQLIMQRMGEVNAMQRMLTDPFTCVVTLIGDHGASSYYL